MDAEANAEKNVKKRGIDRSFLEKNTPRGGQEGLKARLRRLLPGAQARAESLGGRRRGAGFLDSCDGLYDDSMDFFSSNCFEGKRKQSRTEDANQPLLNKTYLLQFDYE